MAVTTKLKLDARKLRADFPIFEQTFHGKPLAFLDSAASSQKPRQMLDAMTHFYETSYANVHRGVYQLAERATEALEGAREKARRLVNAPEAREIVFTRNATESLNLVAYAWGLKNLGPGDLVVVTELEHHSNLVPWQYIAGRTGAGFRLIPLDEQGELRLDALDELAQDGTVRVVATNLVSNSLGTINDVARVVAWARGLGAAIDYLEGIGFEAIEQYEHELVEYALGRLADVPGITLYGPVAERRAGIVSFNIEGVHPHDVAQILDLDGVAIRAGHHCCQPLMTKLGVAATN